MGWVLGGKELENWLPEGQKRGGFLLGNRQPDKKSRS